MELQLKAILEDITFILLCAISFHLVFLGDNANMNLRHCCCNFTCHFVCNKFNVCSLVWFEYTQTYTHTTDNIYMYTISTNHLQQCASHIQIVHFRTGNARDTFIREHNSCHKNDECPKEMNLVKEKLYTIVVKNKSKCKVFDAKIEYI